MRIVFYCPTEIKEIKEIFIPLGAALSVISVISVGHYYLMRIVLLLSRRDKGNKGNLCSDARSLSAISDISSTSEAAKPMTVGQLLSHADCTFIVPQSSSKKLWRAPIALARVDDEK